MSAFAITGARIFDGEVNTVRFASDMHPSRTRLTVLCDVGETFLRDTEKAERNVGRWGRRQRRMCKGDRNIMPP